MKVKMKRMVFLFALLLTLMLVGCGKAETESEGKQFEEEQVTKIVESKNVENPSESKTNSVNQAESVSVNQAESVSVNSAQSDSTENENGTRILVLYFSRTGEQYGVGVIEKGNTAIVADMIAEELGADVFEIIPADDHYPDTYDELTDVAKQEQNEEARPAYQGQLPDLSAYDTIFIGSPVWWGDWPMIMYTVFEQNDFSGKILVPFSTNAGSGLAGFGEKLSAKCPEAEILEGLAVKGTDAQNNKDSVREDVKDWLTALGYE